MHVSLFTFRFGGFMPDIASVVVLLKGLLEQRYGIHAAISADSILEDIGMDSLHVLDLLLDAESALGVRLEGIALPPHATLGQLAAAIVDCSGSLA
jgi:acyl carrier protein